MGTEGGQRTGEQEMAPVGDLDAARVELGRHGSLQNNVEAAKANLDTYVAAHNVPLEADGSLSNDPVRWTGGRDEIMTASDLEARWQDAVQARDRDSATDQASA